MPTDLPTPFPGPPSHSAPTPADVEVLTKIYMALGTPTDESWGGLRAMPAFMEFQPTPAPGLRKIFPASIVGVRRPGCAVLGLGALEQAGRAGMSQKVANYLTGIAA